ncbi:MAG: Zn-dependent hydrolase [Actinomycetota bacterium]|nr:Zn-dependent hydrolase [Actinomycetota bacterium]
MTELRVDGDRLWASLMEMATHGATPAGGVCRLTGSDEDGAGRRLFIEWCEAIGCDVEVDAFGNIFARRAGTDPDRAPVVLGSHLDSQPTGGRFDGVYGVLAGLEVLRTLNDSGTATAAPVEVVSWTNEEGARFAPAMLGSGVFAGTFELAYGLDRADRDGVRLGDELERIGFAGPHPCGGRPVGAYLEAHIEQGPILEAEGLPIGVVTGVQGIRWFDASFVGREAHAGTTPMDRRADAVVAASRLVIELDRLADEHAPDARTTVGELHVRPSSRNTVAGRVELTVDLRHPDADVLDTLDATLGELASTIGSDTGTIASVDRIWASPPVVFDAGCVDAVRTAAGSLGLGHRDITSGAGHDACYLASVAPTAMVFIPCKDGLSHNEAEWADPEHCAAGADVLLGAALRLAS